MQFRKGLIVLGAVMTVLAVNHLAAIYLAPLGLGLAMAIITGERATGGVDAILSNARVVDMSDVIHLLDPNEAPLTAVSMKLRTVTAINPKVEWMEDDYIPSSDTVDGAATTGEGSVGVDNGTYFRPGDVLKVLDTGEVLYVQSISSNELTVDRSVGATTAATIGDGKVLLIIGNANAENSTKRTIITAQKTAALNYCQIFRWEFGASGTLQASELYGGDDLSYQRKKAGKEFRIQMERSYLWGEKAEVTSGQTARRFTDGVIARISTNVTTATTVTIEVFETFLRDAMRYGPARKMLFASRNIMSYLSLIADNKIETRPTDESFPLALSEWKSPHGKVYLATHNLLTGSGANGVSYGGWALCLDLDSIFHRPLKGRNTMLRTNIQANDADGRVDGYLAECGLQVIQEKNHAILNDVAGYA